MRSAYASLLSDLSQWCALIVILSLIGTSCVPTLGDQSSRGRVERDIVYGVVDGVALKMDLYYPKTMISSAPVAVYVHGGGWTRGDKASGAGLPEVQELVNRGYLVAAINYRLAPRYKFPAQIEDVKYAIRYLRANAQKYEADPNRIGAWGGSAGGHLVALLGVTDAKAGFDGSGGYLDQSSRVQAVVDMFGPADLTKLSAGATPRLLQIIFGPTDRNDEIFKRASPVTYVSIDDPPFLILHGELDELVPANQSQILHEKLKATGVPSALVLVKNAGHGFSPAGGPISPSRQEITQMVADFFDRHLRNPRTEDVQVVSQTTMLGDVSTQEISIFRTLAEVASGTVTGPLLMATVICALVITVVCISRKRRRSPDLKR